MSVIDIPVLILAALAAILGLFWAIRVMMVATTQMTGTSLQTLGIAAYAAISLGLSIWMFAMVFS